jgi:hypothetical protein
MLSGPVESADNVQIVGCAPARASVHHQVLGQL